MSNANLHILKIDRRYLEALVDGRKTSEIRFNDRDYQTGDILAFPQELLSDGESIDADVVGKYFNFKITHIVSSDVFRGLQTGYVVLSLKRLNNHE